MLGLIRFYRRWVSPLLPPRCRFIPSCSEYAYEAIECHGVARGSVMSAVRLCKCHPFHPGGFDPVPPKASSSEIDNDLGCGAENKILSSNRSPE